MNRRSFFKIVTGFVAGVCVPKVTGGRRSGTRLATEEEVRKVRGAFLYLRGARLSQAIEGEHKESSKLRSIPVDCVVFDEYDLIDAETP